MFDSKKLIANIYKWGRENHPYSLKNSLEKKNYIVVNGSLSGVGYI
jgi:hypothetical protein